MAHPLVLSSGPEPQLPIIHVFPLQFTLPDPACIAAMTWPAAEPVHDRELPPTVSCMLVIEVLTVLKNVFQLMHRESELETLPGPRVS